MIKYINKYSVYLLAMLLVFSACNEDELIDQRLDENPVVEEPDLTGSAGTADFSTFISIGNSLTAGLMDAALYNRGQANAFPNLLAARFALAGGGDFVQPDINAANGFNVSLNSDGNATFGRFFLDLAARRPAPTTPGDPITPYAGDNSSVDNLGVPGMRLVELTADGYGQLNPFYGRFATSADGSLLAQALAKQPTFMTFWLGNNDALSWATGGGVGATGVDAMGNADPTFDAIPNSLVSTTSFNAALAGSMQAMFGTYPNLKGVILNVPNVTLTPFFQAVPYNSIVLDQATATTLNGAYAGYNQVLDGLVGAMALTEEEAEKRKISFAAGANAAVVVDDQLTDITSSLDFLATLPPEAGGITAEQRAALQPYVQARQLKSVADDNDLAQFGLPGEILTLSAGSVLGTLADPNNPLSQIGVVVPASDALTLTTDEIGLLLTRIAQFNGIIAQVAASYNGLVVYDANALFTQVAVNRGIMRDGFMYAPDFSPNGIFSTDGIHPNPVGHAIIANEVMATIEASFGAELPAYNITDFTTVLSQ